MTLDMISDDFAINGSGKANFDDIYHAKDPRDYFRVLYGLDYVIPDLAKGALRSLIAHRSQSLSRQIKVLDIGCSYGVNAALSRFPLDMGRLAQRYASPEMQKLSPAQLELLDRQYFASWPQQTDATFIGLDAAPHAVAYAKSVGLIADGTTTNLEQEQPTAADLRLMESSDMVISTGCVGYVTHRTFGHILACQRKGPPLIASFVLRMFPYDEIARSLSVHGLTTEKLEGVTFVQRRFHSRSEFDTTLSRLAEHGIDPAGKEADGLLHAELYVSRPDDEVKATPLSDLISVTSGENRGYGRRFRADEGGDVRLVH